MFPDKEDVPNIEIISELVENLEKQRHYISSKHHSEHQENIDEIKKILDFGGKEDQEEKIETVFDELRGMGHPTKIDSTSLGKEMHSLLKESNNALAKLSLDYIMELEDFIRNLYESETKTYQDLKRTKDNLDQKNQLLQSLNGKKSETERQNKQLKKKLLQYEMTYGAL